MDNTTSINVSAVAKFDDPVTMNVNGNNVKDQNNVGLSPIDSLNKNLNQTPAPEALDNSNSSITENANKASFDPKSVVEVAQDKTTDVAKMSNEISSSKTTPHDVGLTANQTQNCAGGTPTAEVTINKNETNTCIQRDKELAKPPDNEKHVIICEKTTVEGSKNNSTGEQSQTKEKVNARPPTPYVKQIDEDKHKPVIDVESGLTFASPFQKRDNPLKEEKQPKSPKMVPPVAELSEKSSNVTDLETKSKTTEILSNSNLAFDVSEKLVLEIAQVPNTSEVLSSITESIRAVESTSMPSKLFMTSTNPHDQNLPISAVPKLTSKTDETNEKSAENSKDTINNTGKDTGEIGKNEVFEGEPVIEEIMVKKEAPATGKDDRLIDEWRKVEEMSAKGVKIDSEIMPTAKRSEEEVLDDIFSTFADYGTVDDKCKVPPKEQSVPAVPAVSDLKNERNQTPEKKKESKGEVDEIKEKSNNLEKKESNKNEIKEVKLQKNEPNVELNKMKEDNTDIKDLEEHHIEKHHITAQKEVINNKEKVESKQESLLTQGESKDKKDTNKNKENLLEKEANGIKETDITKHISAGTKIETNENEKSKECKQEAPHNKETESKITKTDSDASTKPKNKPKSPQPVEKVGETRTQTDPRKHTKASEPNAKLASENTAEKRSEITGSKPDTEPKERCSAGKESQKSSSCSSSSRRVRRDLTESSKVKQENELKEQHKQIVRAVQKLLPEEGNDSGVDENTQSKDGPAKSPPKDGRISPRKRQPRSVDPSPMKRTPHTTASVERKPVPMNKIEVGKSASPNIKNVRSKIGSLDNATYKPGGGKIKIESKKLDFSKAASKIEAKNDKYTPGGGEKKIEVVKLKWNANSKIGSLEKKDYKPGGGDKKVEAHKLNFKAKAQAKVGSKENIKHKAGGGDVEIPQEKLEFKAKASSKVGSLDNVKHKPLGGEKKIFDDKEYLRQIQTSSNASPCKTPTSRTSSGRESGAASPATTGTVSPGPQEG